MASWNSCVSHGRPRRASTLSRLITRGFGLWIFAIGGITALAGLPFFLNFTGIAWVALIGHVLYAIVLVAVMRLAARR